MTGFWIFMTIMNLLIPITMVLCGCVFLYRPPAKINSVCGYRTRMSMKNEDTWKFAHHYFGKFWYRTGLIMLLLTPPVMLLLYGRDEDTVGGWGGLVCFVQCVFMILPILPAEKALKRTFDEEGRRKVEACAR